jgi:hypothetical protein
LRGAFKTRCQDSQHDEVNGFTSPSVRAELVSFFI